MARKSNEHARNVEKLREKLDKVRARRHDLSSPDDYSRMQAIAYAMGMDTEASKRCHHSIMKIAERFYEGEVAELSEDISDEAHLLAEATKAESGQPVIVPGAVVVSQKTK